jgi:hypothetical protein
MSTWLQNFANPLALQQKTAPDSMNLFSCRFENKNINITVACFRNNTNLPQPAAKKKAPRSSVHSVVFPTSPYSMPSSNLGTNTAGTLLRISCLSKRRRRHHFIHFYLRWGRKKVVRMGSSKRGGVLLYVWANGYGALWCMCFQSRAFLVLGYKRNGVEVMSLCLAEVIASRLIGTGYPSDAERYTTCFTGIVD